MKTLRSDTAWQDHTPPDLWPFENPVYTVDATYLYTYAGSNARILAESFSQSKSTNLVKILSFTFLDGVPFWVSKVYAGNVSDQEICEMELNDHPELLKFIGGEITKSPTRSKPSSSFLNSSSLDLEHILYGVPPGKCSKKPIGIFDRGFDQDKLRSMFSLLVTLPDYLYGRISLTEDESLFSAFLSSRRVVIENYHGRVKGFHGLRFKLDMRVATTFVRELWLSATYLCHRNYSPLRQSDNRQRESDLLVDEPHDEDCPRNDYDSFLNKTLQPLFHQISDESSSLSDEFLPPASSSSDEIIISDDCNNIQETESEFSYQEYLQAISTSTNVEKIQLNQTQNLQIPKPSRAQRFVKPMPRDPEGLSQPIRGTKSEDVITLQLPLRIIFYYLFF